MSGTQDGRKIAIVVGGAGGIGREVCRVLAEVGMRIGLMDINEAEAARIVEALPGQGHLLATVDVTDENAVAAAFDRVETEGPAAKLVVIAGGPVGAPDNPTDITTVTLDEWNRTLALNATGTFLCLRKFARLRVDRALPGTQIVLFSSITGQLGGSMTGPAYPASKAAVIGLTRQAAADLAPHGITVNAIAPGAVATEEFKRFIDASAEEQLKARIPLNRVSSPTEIASVVAFLLSDAAFYITGTTIDVNGGVLMR